MKNTVDNDRSAAHESMDAAVLYDLEQADDAEDIGFFVDMAKEIGSPVLELGCGTGRITVPMANAGIDIVALDICPGMLTRCRERLEAAPPETKARVNPIRADMVRFTLKRKFKGAICSSNTLLLGASEIAVANTLACVREHLADNGTIIVDIDAITPEARAALVEYPKGDLPDLQLVEGSGNLLLQRTHSIQKHTAEESVPSTAETGKRVLVTYKYFDALGNVCAERQEDIVLLSPGEFLQIVKHEGYEIIHTFGGYDRRAYSDGERKLIVVGRKRK